MSQSIITANISGKLFLQKDAKISLFDRALLYGDSIFEVALAYGSILFLKEYHFQRLWNSMEMIGIVPTFSKEQLSTEIDKSIYFCHKQNQRQNKGEQSEITYVRIMVSRGEAETLGLDPLNSSPPIFSIITSPHKPHPESYYRDGVILAFSSISKNEGLSKTFQIKSGNYLNNILAYMSAKEQGAYEPILLNGSGHLAEGSTSNLWMVNNEGIIITPPLSAGILDGITRRVVRELAEEQRLPLLEKDILPEEFISAAEIFITSSTRKIMPVSSVIYNGKKQEIAKGKVGPTTLKLMELFDHYLQNYLSERSK